MKLSTLILLIFVMSLKGQTHKSLPTFTPKQDIYNILSYGAVGDSISMNTKAIQDAIDACNSNGGGTVWIPAGSYITGTIHMKSNVTLSLDYGAYLLGSQDISDYETELLPAREGNVHCLIYAENANNIAIEGLGEIDGRGTPEAFPRERNKPRPRLIRMVNCDQLTFSGITYRRPAFWGIHLIDCMNIH
ncbi:MAG: glycosyl hydrolase family 28-related protein, partial [Bacteroides sp.]|nr:glycosyl hydrolase family 28-related protein [Bacteroides sp.]